ncbi:TPM domain-containing protein [Apilactobacillus apinorum]|uniref:TPM domain-containing protein n=1 Tax=Apilactobacillus apinorum TaxID=1218495 RepID=UPI0006B5D74C|nr:TPM domain-containing protein [Apilactobacillus apinorum]KOY68237.1 hypothetical protein RZ74_11660 [Apilactobacillus apinorum]CAI2691156.1 Hypothetical protein AAPFHON13_12640 [Apilactobacillus apinorum]
MKKLKWLIVLALPLLLLAMAPKSIDSHAESTNPTPTKEYVVDDYANILSDSTKQLVINQEKKYQQTETKPQIVVMTVKSTGNYSIDDYADQLLENSRWKFGKKGLDNGVLILFAQNNGQNNVRISTGYGVEDILPDALTNQILQSNKTLLKSSDNNDINKGIQNTFQRVATILDKRYANLSEKQAKQKLADKKPNYLVVGLVFIIIAAIIVSVILLIRNQDDDDNDHHYGGGGGRRSDDGLGSFILGGIIGSLLSSGGRGGSYGGSNGGGFGSSGGGGNFGGGGSSI